MTESGRLCAFITKVRKGSLADTVGHLRPGNETHTHTQTFISKLHQTLTVFNMNVDEDVYFSAKTQRAQA